MTTRTALMCLVFATAASVLIGCGDSSSVSKAQNDAYHTHDAGPPPPSGAMKPKGPAVGPFAGSGGVPPGTAAAAAGAKGPTGK
jgi:hypothetical protein